ncbi:MAG: hypothetical protein GY826_24965 [Fuerstiella sp.]|nr:hypothetical protein [Fuerstiella sp.]
MADSGHTTLHFQRDAESDGDSDEDAQSIVNSIVASGQQEQQQPTTATDANTSIAKTAAEDEEENKMEPLQLGNDVQMRIASTVQQSNDRIANLSRVQDRLSSSGYTSIMQTPLRPRRLIDDGSMPTHDNNHNTRRTTVSTTTGFVSASTIKAIGERKDKPAPGKSAAALSDHERTNRSLAIGISTRIDLKKAKKHLQTLIEDAFRRIEGLDGKMHGKASNLEFVELRNALTAVTTAAAENAAAINSCLQKDGAAMDTDDAQPAQWSVVLNGEQVSAQDLG